MAPASVNPPFPMYFGLWFLVSIGSAAFFRYNRNAALKRRVWPAFLVVASLVFVGIVWFVGRRVEVLAFVVPAVALLTLANLRMVRFCGACGDTVRSASPWRRAVYCPRCGSKLPD